MDLSDIPVTTLRGEQTTFGALTGGKAALVVNVASRCGLAQWPPVASPCGLPRRRPVASRGLALMFGVLAPVSFLLRV